MSEEQMMIVMGWIANAEAFLATCRPTKEQNAIMAQMVGECVARIDTPTYEEVGQSVND